MRPLRVAILTSSSAPGLEQLLASADRGVLFEPVLIQRPLKRILSDSFRNLKAREACDRETADILRAHDADYVILDGYRYLVTAPLLDAFPNHLLSLHDGDLTILDDDGERRYRGLHAVRQAIFAGALETRSSLFFVDERPGAGPLMLLSSPFPVSPIARDALVRGDYDLAIAYARVHREWMIKMSWGDMLAAAIHFLAAGTIAVADGLVWIDGAPGPCRLGEAPAMCQATQVRRDIPASCPFIQRG